MIQALRLHSNIHHGYLAGIFIIGLLSIIIVGAWIYALYTLVRGFYEQRAVENVLANHCDIRIRQTRIWNIEMFKASLMLAIILTITGLIFIPAIGYSFKK